MTRSYVCHDSFIAANRQHQRMLDHRTFKTVLEKLDHVHDLLRGNRVLSHRLLQGGKLSRSELQDLLHGYRIAVCCSVLLCVAVCCSVLQCAAVCCSVLQSVAVCCSML